MFPISLTPTLSVCVTCWDVNISLVQGELNTAPPPSGISSYLDQERPECPIK